MSATTNKYKYISFITGPIAHQVEHFTFNERVTGSSPVGPKNNKQNVICKFMSRSIWKGPYVHPQTKNKILNEGWTMNQLMSLNIDSKDTSENLSVIQKNIQTQEMTKIEIMRNYGIEIKDRNTTILPDFIGKIIKIHKGNSYVPLEIKKDHVGLKLGNLVRTKRIPEYKKKKK